MICHFVNSYNYNLGVKINTLSEALFMRQINDLSFTINDRVVVLFNVIKR